MKHSDQPHRSGFSFSHPTGHPPGHFTAADAKSTACSGSSNTCRSPANAVSGGQAPAAESCHETLVQTGGPLICLVWFLQAARWAVALEHAGLQQAVAQATAGLVPPGLTGIPPPPKFDARPRKDMKQQVRPGRNPARSL